MSGDGAGMGPSHDAPDVVDEEVTMDVLDHLTEEHRKVEAMLSRLKSSKPGPERDRVLDEMTTALHTHMAVEEQHLYPIVAAVIGSEDETEAEVEHGLTREGLAKLDELRREPGFGAALDMIEAGIAHHVHEEESEVFPKLRQKAADQIAALDPATLEAQTEMLDLSRDELYAKAREAGVPGRSEMSKEQLAEAMASRSR